MGLSSARATGFKSLAPHCLCPPELQMLDILEDFLHDFQDPSGLLPKAEEDPVAALDSGGGGAAGGEREASEGPAGRWVLAIHFSSRGLLWAG